MKLNPEACILEEKERNKGRTYLYMANNNDRDFLFANMTNINKKIKTYNGHQE